MSAQEGNFYSPQILVLIPVPHHSVLIFMSLSPALPPTTSPPTSPTLVFLPTPSFSDFLGFKRSLYFRAKAKPYKPSQGKPSLFWRDDIYERGGLMNETHSSVHRRFQHTAKGRHLHDSSTMAFHPFPPSLSFLHTRMY